MSNDQRPLHLRAKLPPSGRSVVLTTLFREGPISRANLARTINMTRGSVSEITRALIGEGLVREKGPAASSGNVGKPSTLIEIDADGHVIIAADIATGHSSQVTLLRGGAYTLFGTPVFETVHRSVQTRGEALVDEVIAFVRQLISDSPLPALAVGIATPGIVDSDDEAVLRSVNLGWEDVPLAQLVSAAVDLPTHIVNENNSTALGEYMFGAADGENVLCMTAGESAGAGLIVDGRLVTGGVFAAGEIAHQSIDPDGERCWCGRMGCLESLFNTRNLTAVSLLPEADRNAELERIGACIGSAFSAVIGVVNPDRWVFCSDDGLLNQAFLRGVRTGLDKVARSSQVEIILHSTDANLAARGAVVVALQRAVGIL